MWNNPFTWFVVATLAVLLGVDMKKNPQSWRNIPLRFGDVCRSLYFWPGRLRDAHRYRPLHSHRNRSLPAFMATWHLLVVNNVASQR